MAILLSLIKSLELFLNLKNASFYYEIRFKSKNKQKEILDEIEKLRNDGGSSSADRADLLRMELKREREELENLSAFYFKTSKESTNSNP